MALQNEKSVQPLSGHQEDELILVVKRSDFFHNEDAWQGLKQVDFDAYLTLIQEKKEFLPRSVMETDISYKQIIPYLVFSHNDEYFLMQRTSNQTESRLRNKFSLGIGGHIRQEDLTDNSIFSWAKREFHEEVNYEDTFSIEPVGILNDDSTSVGQVHVGFVFLLKGTAPNISVKSELKSGFLVPLKECKEYYENLESWSQIVFNFLAKD